VKALRIGMSRGMCAVMLWLVSTAVSADVYVFGTGDAADPGQRVTSLSGASGSSPQPSVFVSGNAVAVDSAGNRLYFAEPMATGSRINRMNYTAASSFGTLIELPTVRVTHLAYDASPVPRLLVLAKRLSDDRTVLFPVVLATATAGSAVELNDDFTIGVSAFRGSDDRWYLLTGIATPALKAVQVDSGTMNSWAVPTGQRIAELEFHPTTQTLYGLVDDAVAGGTRLAELTPAAMLNIDPLGTVDTDCCFVLAGPATIDVAAGRLYAITRDRNGVVPMAPSIVSFGLTDGGQIVEAEMTGNALFSDTNVVFVDLFGDGFEP